MDSTLKQVQALTAQVTETLAKIVTITAQTEHEFEGWREWHRGAVEYMRRPEVQADPMGKEIGRKIFAIDALEAQAPQG